MLGSAANSDSVSRLCWRASLLCKWLNKSSSLCIKSWNFQPLKVTDWTTDQKGNKRNSLRKGIIHGKSDDQLKEGFALLLSIPVYHQNIYQFSPPPFQLYFSDLKFKPHVQKVLAAAPRVDSCEVRIPSSFACLNWFTQLWGKYFLY